MRGGAALGSVLGMDHVAIPVASIAASEGWYGHLGFERTFARGEPPALVQMRTPGGAMVELLVEASGALRPGHFALAVDDVDATVGALAGAGVRATDPRTGETGVRFAFLTDPDGHRIELIFGPAPAREQAGTVRRASFAFGGTHALVTGAGAGIGRATALALAHAGAHVSMLDVDAEGLERTLAVAGDHGSRLASYRVDVTDAAALEAVHAASANVGGPVGLLVNNAGSDARHDALRTGADEWRRLLAVNLDHHFLLARLVAPGMAEAGGGAIVNLTSTAWMKGAASLSAYHAAKAGIVGLTRGLAREWGPKGIRVNAVAPGRVVTERVRGGVATPEWEAETRAMQCLPELIAPSDVADTILWLASDAARMVTGQTIVVDGGVV